MWKGEGVCVCVSECGRGGCVCECVSVEGGGCDVTLFFRFLRS